MALRLSAALRAAGFTHQAITQLTGAAGQFHIQAGELIPLQRRLRTPSPLTTLTRLFCAGLSCTIDDVKAALDTPDLQPWIESRLFDLSGNEIIPLIAIQCV